MSFSRYIGEFDLSLGLIERWPSSAKFVMKDIIIIRAECLYHEDIIRYIGISEELFDYVNLGDEIPRYQLVSESSKNVLAYKI